MGGGECKDNNSITVNLKQSKLLENLAYGKGG